MAYVSLIVTHVQQENKFAFAAAQKAFQSWDIKALFAQAAKETQSSIKNSPSNTQEYIDESMGSGLEESVFFRAPVSGNAPDAEISELTFTQADLRKIKGLEPLNQYISILQFAFNERYQQNFNRLKNGVKMPEPEIVVHGQNFEQASYAPNNDGEGFSRLRRDETARNKAAGGEVLDEDTGKEIPFGALTVFGKNYNSYLELQALENGYTMDIIFPAP